MTTPIPVWAAVLLALSTNAAADNAKHQTLAEMDNQAQVFVHAPQYTKADVEALTGDAYYSSHTFPGYPGTPSTVTLPDASLDAITRSVLLLEAHEAPLPHVRYRISYSVNGAPDYPELRHDHVEVTRYNLGPARRNDLKTHVPEHQLADPDEFGVGPHVSWRFVLSPVMGMQAALLYAGRAEMNEAQAQAADCLGEPCLSLNDAQGPDYAWQSFEPPQPGAALYNSQSDWGVARPARAVQELWTAMSMDGMDPVPYVRDQPAFQFVVSLNTDGQEAVITSLARQGTVMDSSVAEIWTKRVQIGPHLPDYSVLFVSRQ